LAGIVKVKKHSLDQDTARERAEEIVKKLESKYGIKYSWKGDDRLSFEGKGAKGTVELNQGEVKVSVDLSFLLKPMKGKIEQAIDDQFDKKFS